MQISNFYFQLGYTQTLGAHIACGYSTCPKSYGTLKSWLKFTNSWKYFANKTHTTECTGMINKEFLDCNERNRTLGGRTDFFFPPVSFQFLSKILQSCIHTCVTTVSKLCHMWVWLQGSVTVTYLKTEIICDTLQQKVPYSTCYKLLVWYQILSILFIVISAQQSFQVKRSNIIGCKLWSNPGW